MATFQRRFGTYDLDASNGILVESWSEAPQFNLEIEDRVDGQGGIRTRDSNAGRIIELSGEIAAGGDADGVRSLLGQFVGAFRNREDYLQLYNDRRILCGLAGPIDISYPKGMQFARVRWSLKLQSRWPTWEAIAVSADTVVVAGSAVIGLMPANLGDAAVQPTFLVTNTGATFAGRTLSLTNVTTGRQFRVDGLELKAGQSIILDFREQRLGGGISIETRVGGISGGWWEILPLTTQTFRVDVSAAPMDLSIDTTFHAQYWSA